MNSIHKEIKQDTLIWKFNFYGFFKNFKFFEPYLLLYLLTSGINLFQIGILFSIRESIIYIFEIPSGIIADKLGNRKVLLSCFVFYIISFVFFALGNHFWNYIFAMIFYGFGEAFRSGTHKAMIYEYLEQKNWYKHKGFVYGRTRSFSLLGSALSAVLSILLIWLFKDIKILFWLSIIPYIIDFLLVSTYPKSLDISSAKLINFSKFFKESIKSLKSIIRQKYLLKIVLSSASFGAFFAILKDYIQPILKLLIISSFSFMLFAEKSSDENLKFMLGVIYTIIYLISSLSSRNSFLLKKYFNSARLMNFLFSAFSIVLIIIAVSINFNLLYFVAFLYLLLFVFQNLRRPFFFDLLGDYLKKDERTTVLSIESQLKSIFIIVLAPIIGLVAEEFGLVILIFSLGLIILVLNKFLKL